MIKTFEQYNDDKYVIVTEHPEGLIVSVQVKPSEENIYSFLEVNDLGDSKVAYYTLAEAKNAIVYLKLRYSKNFIWNIIPADDLDVIINSNKYNL